jgi:DNA-binding transcriptional regulator YiaG
MTPETFQAIRESADIDRQELADIILFSPATGAKTVKEFETGRRPTTGPVCVIMRLVQHGYLDAVIAASEAEDVVRMAGVEPARPGF